MAEDVDNLVLVQLRDIRAKLEGLDRLERRFEAFEKRHDRIEYQMTNLFGTTSMARNRAERAEDVADELDVRGKRTDERLQAVERRVSALEERVPPRP